MINIEDNIFVRTIKTSWKRYDKRYNMAMKLSVVIPTRGDQNMKNIIECLQRQTFKDFEIIFVVDKKIDAWSKIHDAWNIHYITNLTHTIPYNNASALRNLGIKAAKWTFIQLMDDDERFEEDYLERSLSFWDEYHALLKKDFVLTPTLMYRKTWQIQNQGFSRFNYRLSRPIPQILWHTPRDYIQMYSWNSLLAPAHIFKHNLFDENLDFVYEDLDFSYRIHHAGCPIIVLRDLRIYHMERDKTKLEQARVGNEYSAFRKAKHRMLFVKKYWTFFQKIQFYLLGFWWQPLWLILKVLRFAKKHEKWKLITAIWKWTFYWLYTKRDR